MAAPTFKTLAWPLSLLILAAANAGWLSACAPAAVPANVQPRIVFVDALPEDLPTAAPDLLPSELPAPAPSRLRLTASASPLPVLSAPALPSPSASPTPVPSLIPAATALPQPQPTPFVTPDPRIRPTPLPTATPTPLPSVSPTPAPERSNSLQMVFGWVPPGTFAQGSPVVEGGRRADEYVHLVAITRGFYLQRTEVTRGQWRSLLPDHPSTVTEGPDDLPISQVNWEDTQIFLAALNARHQAEGGTGRYRLPTEAEWEYAARAGTTTAHACGGILGCVSGLAWFANNAEGQLWPVAQKSPNPWGLYDMHGNVSEWTQSWYGPYPRSASVLADPQGPAEGTHKVARGGGADSASALTRSAYRHDLLPDLRDAFLGFRVLWEP